MRRQIITKQYFIQYFIKIFTQHISNDCQDCRGLVCTSSNLHMCSIKTIIIMILPHCCSVMWHLKPKKTAQLCGADQVDLFTIISSQSSSSCPSLLSTGRQCLESPPGLVQCVCAPSCPDHWKPVSVILHHHNHHSQQHDDDDRHRCVEAMVFHMTTTVSSIELLVFKRFIFLPYMKAFAGIIVMIMFFFFLCLFIYFFYY